MYSSSDPHVTFSHSVQEFWGNGGPDNSGNEDTSSKPPAWTRRLCWRQGQEARKRVTQPDTEHREGWAGESNALKDSVNIIITFVHLLFVSYHHMLWCRSWPFKVKSSHLVKSSDSTQVISYWWQIASLPHIGQCWLTSVLPWNEQAALAFHAHISPCPCPLPTPPGALVL